MKPTSNDAREPGSLDRIVRLARRPWVASNQYGMHFILSQDNEILLRADWMPMEILQAMVKAANDTQPPNDKVSDPGDTMSEELKSDAGAGFAAPYGSAQDTLDWKVFAELYMKERGFYPHERDRMHRELFHWFTQGAHSEMMGRLTPAPNDQGQR